MKLYLTPEQFSKLTLSRFYNKRGTWTSSISDEILYVLFKEYESDILQVLEGSLWNLDKVDSDIEAVECIGPSFHKTFRQCGVIDSPHIDMVIWKCLTDAPHFWDALTYSSSVLTDETKAQRFIGNTTNA